MFFIYTSTGSQIKKNDSQQHTIIKTCTKKIFELRKYFTNTHHHLFAVAVFQLRLCSL